MRILKPTRELRMQAMVMLLFVPLLALNMWILYKGFRPKSKLIELFDDKALVWFLFQTVLIIVCSYLLYNAKKIGALVFTFFMIGVSVVDVNIFLNGKNYALAFYSLFLMILSLMYWIRTWDVLRAPYFNPKRKWFQGLPDFLPRIHATLLTDKGEIPAQMSSLSEAGCYVWTKDRVNVVQKIEIQFEENKIFSDVELISKTAYSLGNGLRFLIASEDD